MRLLDRWLGRPRPGKPGTPGHRGVRPVLERLEDRCVPDATGVLNGTDLVVTGTPVPFDRITLSLDAANKQIVLSDNGTEVSRFSSDSVTGITVNTAARLSIVRIDPALTQPATVNGGAGTNFVFAGSAPSTLVAGPGGNRLAGGAGDDLIDGTQGVDVLSGGGGTNTIIAGDNRDYVFGAKDRDTLMTPDGVKDPDLRLPGTAPNLSSTLGLTPSPQMTLTASEVGQLLQRAAGATASDDGIVAVVDREGRILGVRVEGNVSPLITQNTHNLVFAIDGAVALARTGAFFGNNQAPLTSRTIQFISQTTITQREVESDPSITDPNSTLRGPGTVGAIGIAGHFPPNVPFTPQVDLFRIEDTNRNTTVNPRTGQTLPAEFNVNPAFIPASVPAGTFPTPEDSYGFLSGLEPNAQPRGIGTLPGGIPIFKNNVEVGGIGVFFPGTTGFADAENSSLQSNFDPTKPDRSIEAEFDAFAAVGGSHAAGFPIGTVAGVAPLPGFDLPFGRIDLVGIQLPLFGPGTPNDGAENLVRQGQSLGVGDPNSGVNEPLLQHDPTTGLVTPGVSPAAPNNLLDGVFPPEGFLVTPHDGVGITAAQVTQIIAQGVQQAVQTRAAIRLPLNSQTRMVFAVADETGQVLGLFRMPDSTIFSIDVAVAKARNVAYYANPAELQPQDQTPGVPPGVAFTNRTFRFLALPFFPEGINGAPPGPFSILNDGGVDPTTALNVGPPLPASAFQSVAGFDAFNPQTNFRDPFNLNNQNGIVFFPGSSPLYTSGALIGGFGVSGDGVDQDDVVTTAGQVGFEVPPGILRADQVFVNGVRLPFQKTNRQPLLNPQ
jgi:uncharacterized protein GlcG (DUF336 family)